MPEKRRIPVVLDTDIGGDIDDTWALAMMLKSPELDVKLITSGTGNTRYRAAIIARLLEVAGRIDIPVGIGVMRDPAGSGPQQPWVEKYDISRFPGIVHTDGVRALIDTILKSPEEITLIGIGPATNIAAALDAEPGIARKCRFVGMFGSIRRHHEGADGAIAEYNVAHDIPACQKVFTAGWKSMVITPMDTCGMVRLKGNLYAAVYNCPDPLIRAVIENYRIWLQGKPEQEQSSILFDTVAIYLAFTQELLVMEKMGLRVTDEGFTVRDPNGPSVGVAMDWKDLAQYEEFLVGRLTG